MANAASADLSAQFEPHKERMITHMNEDHGDSLLVYAKHYANCKGAIRAVITDMNTEGLFLDVFVPGGEIMAGVFVKYTRPLTSVRDVRSIVVDMHHEAYNALGVAYKLQSGYYKTQFSNSWKKNPMKKKVAMGAAAVSILGLSVFAYRKLQARARL
eukprot:TRINITY_DN98031_c0_g1_i1.p2 TRINITY_DN98031_c0_g1~~TRINITY_DN98031_c0_g1_i1.p2  ORF type:complete len:157 (-),score=27.92 TRINITY_DN98031_c0_g1_i1:3-473(-)